MALFKLTSITGESITVNTETVTYLEDYDRDGVKEEIQRSYQHKLASYRDVDPTSDVFKELQGELKRAFENVDKANTKVHLNGGPDTWLGVTETQDQVKAIANTAVAATSNQKPGFLRSALWFWPR